MLYSNYLKMSKKKVATFLTNKTAVIVFIALIILTILGFFIRTIGISSGNILFLFDPARDLLYVKKIIVDFHPLLIGPSSGGLQGYFHGVLWYYFLAIPFFLSHGNPVAITLFVAIISTASIVYTFFLLKKITSPLTALLGGTIFAFAYFSVQTSIFPWNPYPIIWLMPFLVYGLYSFSQKQRHAVFLVAFLVGLMIHFEVIYGITLIPTLLVMLVIQTLRNKNLKQSAITLALSAGLLLLPFLPTVVFDLRHDFLITRSLLTTVQTGGENITHDEKDRTEFSERLKPRLNDLYTYSIASLSPQPLMNLGILVLVFIGIGTVFKEKDKHVITFIGLVCLSLLVPFFLFLLLKYAVWSYYWIGSPPLYALSATILTWYAFKKSHYSTYILIGLIVSLLIVYNPLQKLGSWQKGDFDPGTGIFSNQLLVVNTIYQDAKDAPFSVYVLTPPVYDYVYRYLFWWKATISHQQLPIDTKQKIVYIIVEKGSKIQDSSYFLKNVVKTTNKPVKIFNFRGGPVVEKIITSPGEPPFDINFLPPL